MTPLALGPGTRALAEEGHYWGTPTPIPTVTPSPTPMPVARAAISHQPGYMEFSVTVLNAAGGPVLNLKRQDFVVSAQGHDLPTTFFRRDEGIAVGLLVDTSGSMETKLLTVEKSLRELLYHLGSFDQVFLVAFNEKAYLLQPLTTDHVAVGRAFSLMHPNGETAIYDAVRVGAVEIANAKYSHRYLVLITDGGDNRSAATGEDASAELRKSGAALYAIGIGDPDAKKPSGMSWLSISVGPFTSGPGASYVDAEALRQFASETGGKVFIVPTLDIDQGKALNAAVSSISKAMNGGYTIGLVVPPGTPGTPEVLLANHPNLNVTANVIYPPPAPPAASPAIATP